MLENILLHYVHGGRNLTLAAPDETRLVAKHIKRCKQMPLGRDIEHLLSK